MIKKYLKGLGLVVCFTLIVGIGFFANAFFGNPISKMLATHTAEKYLATTYADTDYYIERINYNFKDGNYHAFIKSPTSIDTEFSFYITMLGKFRLDTYEDVLNGANTFRRIEQEYRELTDTVFNNPVFPYHCDISFGTLELYPEEFIDNSQFDDVPDYAINQNELVLDKVYDIRELGKHAGHLVIYVDSDNLSIENAAEIMLNIKDQFDEAGIPFAAMNFTLQYPKPEQGKRPEDYIGVHDFRYDQIHEDGIVDRVRDADKALKEYYELQDKKYK